MSSIIILVGIPGSGKSTVLEESIKLLPQLHVINYGDIMLKEASLHNIDKDTLRKLPFSEQQKLGIEAARKIAANLPEIVCIDTHAMIKTPFGYCPGIPEEVLNILKPDLIGMIECSAPLISERRSKDTTRNRDAESPEQIEYHQTISRSFLIACCVSSGALYVPVNNNGTPVDAARQLVKAIQSQILSKNA